MRQNVLVMMSLSGSMIFLLYMLLSFLLKQSFPPAWRAAVLKVTLFFFLFPLPEFKYRILNIVYLVFSPSKPLYSRPITTHFDIILDESKRLVRLSPKMQLICVLVALSVLISLILIIRNVKRYRRVKIEAFSNTIEVTSGPIFNYIQKFQKELKIRPKIRIYHSAAFHSPVLIGVFRPSILLPLPDELDGYGQTFSDALRHELIHVKHHDLLIKFVGLFALSLHWFNPLCYLFYDELCDITELSCDAEVMRGKNSEERRAYCALIIEVASYTERQSRCLPVSSLMGNNARALKKRILAVKDPNLKPRKILSCIAGTVIIISGLLTTLAYDAPVIAEKLHFDGTFTSTFVPGPLVLEIDPLPFDRFFTSDSGVVSEVTDPSQGENASCSHKLEPGTYTDHVRLSDGNCNLQECAAKKCSACGYLEIERLLSSESHTACPH